MRIRRKGIFRLWIVLGVVFTLGMAEWTFQQQYDTWSKIDDYAIKVCVDGQDHENVWACEKRMGVGKTMFQHESISVGKFWGEAIGLSFLVYCVLTAVVAAFFFVFRWIVRGFQAD